jgi:hypothetical protein
MVNVREEACDPSLLLGILNSALLRVYWLSRFYDQRRTFPKIKGSYLGELPIKLPKTPAEGAVSKRIVKLVDQRVLGQTRFHTIPHLLHKKVAHTSDRTPCSLAHYLQKDFAAVLKHEILLDDVQRAGFVHTIMVESESKQVTVSATIADDGQSSPRSVPIVLLEFKDVSLRQFVYACWRRFLEEHARQKKWTKGKKPEPIYPLIANLVEPLVYFAPGAGDNLRVIRETMEAVAQEAGSADLAALETEIERLDREIDTAVYELYGLTPEEVAVVEASR